MKIAERSPRNNLEQFCWELLKKEGIEFEYEPFAIELVPSFSIDSKAIEHTPKKGLSPKTQKVQNIVYTPDFVGKKWIIETKGLRRPSFDLRWKLFKKYLNDKKEQWLLLMPSNQKEVLQAVDLVKQFLKFNGKHIKDWGVLSISQDIQQLSKRSTKSKALRSEKKVPRAVRTRRHHFT